MCILGVLVLALDADQLAIRSCEDVHNECPICICFGDVVVGFEWNVAALSKHPRRAEFIACQTCQVLQIHDRLDRLAFTTQQELELGNIRRENVCEAGQLAKVDQSSWWQQCCACCRYHDLASGH